MHRDQNRTFLGHSPILYLRIPGSLVLVLCRSLQLWSGGGGWEQLSGEVAGAKGSGNLGFPCLPLPLSLAFQELRGPRQKVRLAGKRGWGGSGERGNMDSE